MRNLLFTLSYRGSGYHGSQVQKNALTLTSVFQDAMERVTGLREDIKCCSRLDAGVHAREFCISVITHCPAPLDGFLRGLNACLPGDVAVRKVQQVPENFHARYSCRGKEYRYEIHNAPVRDPMLDGMVWEYPHPLHETFLHQQAQDLVGRHDFSAFCSAGGSVEDRMRTISYCSVEREGKMVFFVARGDGFLYNMVRIMVGTLIDIGAGKIPPGGIPAILASQDREKAGRTAPACGLYLHRVFYDGIQP